RNRLLFDLKLVSSPRTMMLNYEEFVATPESGFHRIYAFAGSAYPGPRVSRGISAASARSGKEIRLSDEVERCCEALWRELLTAYREQLRRPSTRFETGETGHTQAANR